MATVGALLITLGFLALVIGGLLFLPISRLRARRLMAKKLTIGGATAFIVGVVATPTPPADAPAAQPSLPTAVASAPIATPTVTPPAPAPAPAPLPTATISEPRVVIDSSLLPILNADLIFAGPLDQGSFPSIGAAMGDLGNRMNRDPSALGEASAINVMVRRANSRPALHFTVTGAELRAAAAADRPAPYYLNLAREPGFNDIAAERAARKYCSGAGTAFCNATR